MPSKSTNNPLFKPLLSIIVPCSDRVITLDSLSYVITSPNYPDPYTSGTLCTWFVTSSVNTTITAQINDFFTPVWPKDYDRLIIGSDYETSDEPTVLISGIDAPVSVTSPGDNMWLRFITAWYFPEGGFSLTLVSKHLPGLCVKSCRGRGNILERKMSTTLI